MISDRLPENYDPKSTVLKDADLVPPTFTRSVFNSINSAGLSGFQAINVLAGLPNKGLNETYTGLQNDIAQGDEAESTGQAVGRFLPKMIGAGLGYMTNPITAVPAIALEAGAGLAAPFVGKALPKLATMPLFSKTVGALGTSVAKGAGGFAGMSIPDEVIQNFNQDTRSLNWGGFAKGEAANGAMGMGFGVIGFAAGVIWHGLKQKYNTKPPMPGTKEARSALATLEEKHAAGEIPTDQFEWYRDMLTDPHRADLQERATKILGEQGHNVDHANSKAYFEMLSAEDLNNLKSIFPQQLNDLMEDKTALSDYVIHSKLALMEHQLEGQKKKLKEADKILKDHLTQGVEERMPFDQKDIYEIVKKGEGEHLPMTVPEHVEAKLREDKENVKFSVSKPFGEHSITVNLETQHGQARLAVNNTNDSMSVGSSGGRYFSIPAHTAKIDNTSLKIERNKIHSEHKGKGYGKKLYKAIIKYAQEKGLKVISDDTLSEDAMRVYRSLQKEGYVFKENKDLTSNTFAGGNKEKYISKQGGAIFELISAPKVEEAKLLSAQEELEHIKSKLFEKKKLIKNFDKKKEYQRLAELADVWHNAASLLDRVNLEADYRKAEAHKVISQKFLDVLDSNIEKFANKDRVMNYLKKKIEEQNGLVGETKAKEVKSAIPESQISEGEHEALLQSFEEEITETGAKNISKDFNESKKRYSQFKENTEALKNMIDCMGRK